MLAARVRDLFESLRHRCVGLPLVISVCGLSCTTLLAEPPERIINSHLHTAYLGMDDAAYRQQVLQEMEAHNIERAVLHLNEASDVEDWVLAVPDKFLAGPAFPCFAEDGDGTRSCRWDEGDWPSLGWLRAHFEQGTLTTMGEMLFVYAGIAPTDSKMAPYWALADEFDVPVFVHINRGPPPNSPSRPTGCCASFDADLGNPDSLRPVLEEYPRLRVVLQHAGFPAVDMLGGIGYLDETFAILAEFPNVHVDMTALNSAMPEPMHAAAVREFIDRGFGDRIMFGTDNWDAAPIVERYQNLSFLTEAQRNDIFYANAARFLRLTAE